MTQFQEFVAKKATELAVPGVVVGVWANGEATYAGHGVTNVEHPEPVDEHTLFLLGSVTKTYTSTALLRLVADGRVELDAPVRRYIPELRLSDERATNEVTVLQLLNHTSGLDWSLQVDTGEGDDAQARQTEKLAELKLIAPPGTRASYSQSGYNLLGRLIEKVTGQTYEQAIAELVTKPVGLASTFFNRDDVMTRRFSVGHNADQDGNLEVARPWRHWRAHNPGGGIAASAADALRWARFHLGDGRNPEGVTDGTRVVPAEILHRMRVPTVELKGSSLGDAIGICWFLREVDGVRAIGHGGSSNGQFAELLIVPERDFAVISLSNTSPTGTTFNQAAVRFALQHFAGLDDRDPEPMPYDDARAREVAGGYENDAMTLTIEADGSKLVMECLLRPELRENAEMELPPDYPPAEFGLLPGDEYIVTEGGLSGLRGFFTRGADGSVAGIDLAGRLFTRTP
ncbi:serine hydrolase domain-containing protein [Flindersiella endophytica]